MGVKDYDLNPDNNTQINGINIAEGCPPSGINNAVRQLMADVKADSDAQNEALTTFSETPASAEELGPVKVGDGLKMGEDGTLSLDLVDAVDSTSTTQAATANAVKTAYDKAEEAASKAGLPLGHIFAWPFPTAPDGCIILNGSTYNRNLYTDFFAYIKSKGWTKTETEWQSIARSNNGFCPWYSEGDGSTNFRTPKFAPHQKIALASGDAGKYHEAGLPNITGSCIPGAPGRYVSISNFTGAFSYVGNNLAAGDGSSTHPSDISGIGFDASRSNSIYGNSTTVQPESHDWIICAVAFGTATNVGSVDIANVMSAVGQVQANPNLQGTAHIVETWKSSDELSWYRKYSDGWIEQGAYVKNSTAIVFPIAFSNKQYTFVAIPDVNDTGNAVWNIRYPTTARSVTGITNVVLVGTNAGWTGTIAFVGGWYACGY